MSACPSVCPDEQLGLRWADCHEILRLSILPKYVQKIPVSLKSDKNTLHEDHHTFMIILLSSS